MDTLQEHASLLMLVTPFAVVAGVVIYWRRWLAPASFRSFPQRGIHLSTIDVAVYLSFVAFGYLLLQRLMPFFGIGEQGFEPMSASDKRYSIASFALTSQALTKGLACSFLVIRFAETRPASLGAYNAPTASKRGGCSRRLIACFADHVLFDSLDANAFHRA